MNEGEPTCLSMSCVHLLLSAVCFLACTCSSRATMPHLKLLHHLSFPQVLYLHGNQIASLHDVLKLSKLPKLQKLTLHGNPISEKANYKVWVLSHLPELKVRD